MKVLIYISIIISCLFISCGENSSSTENKKEVTVAANPEQMVQAGEALFSQNCSMCHGINATEGTNMAPILDSVKTHWPDKAVLGSYVKNAKEMLNTNSYTSKLYEQWKTKPQMPPYLGMSDLEIQQIVEYLHYVSH